MKKLTLKEFVQRSNIRHSNKYNYSRCVYQNSTTEVEIICPIHGPFPQTPKIHMNGSGCPDCAINMVAKL